MIVDCAFANLLQVKRASPLQDYWGYLAFAFADMDLQPIGNDPRPRSAANDRGKPDKATPSKIRPVMATITKRSGLNGNAQFSC